MTSPDDQPEQQYRHQRIEYEDGTIRDHHWPWPTDQQLAKLTTAEQTSLRQTRAQALYLAVKNLFEGTTPGMPKATRMIAQWTGPEGTQPDG